MTSRVRFDGRVAVVTGAGHGLGRSYAKHLAARGAKVVVNDVEGGAGSTRSSRGSTKPAADIVVEEIRARGGDAVGNYGDVTSVDDAKGMIAQALDRFGGVDIVINNAGVLRDKTFAKMPIEDFVRIIEVHLLGTAYVTHAAWPHMKASGYGRVVFTSSSSGLYGNFGQSNYAAAKLGVVGLMNVLKIEGAKYGIHVNTVAPLASTRLGADVFPDALKPALLLDYVAAMVAYLCWEGNQVSGEIVEVGAGRYARARLGRNDGVVLPDGVTAEDIADRLDDILQPPTDRHFVRSREAMADFCRQLSPQQ